MTKNTQNINAFFDGLDDFMTIIVPHVISETAVDYYHARFLEKNWEGSAWPKYNPFSKKGRREPKRGSLMMRSNNLFRSVRPAVVNRNQVRISAGSSKVPYAKVHNEGIQGYQIVPSHVNSNFMGKGRPVQIKTYRKFVNIPRRQFIGRSVMLNQTIQKRLITAFNDSKK